ncbi:hypothetical protein EK599_10495 [Vibrio sp. T187]|uniref:TSUP family transporter n=1 Tax=Vibrio TaxID=662 RepID=UPI0010C98ACA|nr:MULTISPECIES: TSUP family transporter [Vibrio]MBW3696128.1 hypothetical protein [Vibrio sp. T187]
MESLFGSALGSELLIMLFCISIIAGAVDAIAGGGGLITVPSLMLSGMSPMTVLGTNRLQAVIGELTTSITFFLTKQMNTQGLLIGLAFTAIGASVGAFSVNLLDKEVLEVLLPILMVAITVYSIFSKRLKSTSASEATLSVKQFMIFGGLSIGFYNGFFGPGTGSIWMVAFVALLGYTAKQATIMTKPLNLMGNIASLLLFMSVGHVNYAVGLIMGLGQIIGSLVGSKMVISKGDTLVRPIFISVTVVMTGKLLYEQIGHYSFIS